MPCVPFLSSVAFRCAPFGGSRLSRPFGDSRLRAGAVVRDGAGGVGVAPRDHAPALRPAARDPPRAVHGQPEGAQRRCQAERQVPTHAAGGKPAKAPSIANVCRT
eukprot:2644336-Pyramimonas_sp.AAC.1